ncbi:hypothetical protein GNP82_11195 [Aliivibrio fischeri]|uniref:hypothetical protein n=1 Tax=Aliivibrio fischeri TaxID=668 RepID=UPI0012D9A826|nr:hypothetical protein [Aliivibrio fischeri]MUK38117.1 hypothetical protein [Aliivibrio fischeri]MUL04030.1 hypothetical protein [Aliivibrio fischeri]
MLSSIVASGVSYLLNVTLIFLLDDKAQYANYLSINSWAVYFSTFSYLSIIDLYISPESKEVELSSLLNVSLSTLFSSSLFLLLVYLLIGYEYFSLSVIIAAIFYAFVKLLTQYMLFTKQIDGVVVLRYGRSFFIGIVIVSLYAMKELLGVTINSEGQLYIQGGICFLLILTTLYTFKINFSYRKEEVIEIYSRFKMRIVKRNVSMIFDMIHMPILYHLISLNSKNMGAGFIYAIGLILPMSYVLSVIIKEQVLIRLDSIGYYLVTKIAKAILMLVAVLATLVVLTMHYIDVYQIISLCILGVLIIFSGCVGLNIYKKGLEKYDLYTNIIVMVLLLIIYNMSFSNAPQWKVFLAVNAVSLKFIIQNILSVFGKESVGVSN